MEKYNKESHKQSPYISVIMAAYNSEAYIAQAVESILAQTFPDFELIIIDDASTDRTEDIVKKYTDKRIRFMKRETKLNQSACRNTGIWQARGKYIAIMDSDDIAMPQRLAVQSAFLDEHPDVTVVGSWYYKIDKEGNIIKLVVESESDNDIKLFLALKTRQSCLCHPSTIFRKDAILAIGGYDENIPQMEDKDLWMRLAAEGHIFVNLRIPLLKKREIPSFAQEYILKEQMHKRVSKVVYSKNRAILESLYKRYKKRSIAKIPEKELTEEERRAYAEFYIKLGLALFYSYWRRQARTAFLETIKCAYRPFVNVATTSHIAYFLFLETSGILKRWPLRRIYYLLITPVYSGTYFTLLRDGNFSMPPSTFKILSIFFKTFFSKKSLAALIGIKKDRTFKPLDIMLERLQQYPTIEEEVSAYVNRMLFFISILDFQHKDFLVFGEEVDTVSSILRAKGKHAVYAASTRDLQRLGFSGDRFDCIFCLLSFNDIVKSEILLKQFIATLRSGGYLYCCVHAPRASLEYCRQDATATAIAYQYHNARRKMQRYERLGGYGQGVVKKVFLIQKIEPGCRSAVKRADSDHENKRYVFETTSEIESLFRKD